MKQHGIFSCIVLAGFGIFCITPCLADIKGSKHDFSTKAWNRSGELCLPCHTPHNANTNPALKPLWNHKVTQATYTLYSSATVTAEQPHASSLQCLSCHDGTVALDSFGGNEGNTFIDGEALVGIDLSNDHPVSVKWTHHKTTNCNSCHIDANMSNWSVKKNIPFFDGYVECSSCHDVHGNNNKRFLRKPVEQLCLYCHEK